MIRNIVFDIGGVLMIRFMPREKPCVSSQFRKKKSLRFLRLRFIVNGGRNWIVGFFDEEEDDRVYMQEDAPEYVKDIAYFMMNGKRDSRGSF